MDENEGSSVRGTGFEVVNAVAINQDVVTVNIHAPEVEADTLVGYADRVGIEGHAENDDQQEQSKG